MILGSVHKIKSPMLVQMHRQGVIPSFYHTDVHTLLYVMQIAYRCGARTFEFVHHRDSRSLRFFSLLVQEAASMPGMKVGVGAVLNATTAKAYIREGATFVASPFIHEQTAKICNEHQALWIPGCTHLHDVATAVDYGAEAITILPISGSGSSFMKQVLAEYPNVALIPSFGIRMDENTLPDWFDAGALCIRLGEVLFPKEAVAIRDWMKIEQHVFQTLETVKQIKSSLRIEHLQSVL